MSLDERISALIKQIYRAGQDAEAWNRLTIDVLRLTGAHSGLTSVVDLRRSEFSAYRAYGSEDTSFARGMEEYPEMYRQDPTLIWGASNPDERFVHSGQTLPTERYETNDYVKWNRARFKSSHWCVAYTPGSEDLSFSFSLHFPAEKGPGDARSVRLFRMLFDHMECAVRLNHRPFSTDSERSIILLNGDGIVRQLSRGAEQVLAETRVLAIVNNRLLALSSKEQAKLDCAIARVGRAIDSGEAAQAIELANPSGPSWILILRPMMRSYGPFGSLACDVQIELLDRRPRLASLEIVRSLFDLTARELHVVRLLGDGHSIDTLAAKMGISPNTARTHLRAIFAKTRTSRQSELLQLCSSLSNSADAQGT
jgi:DNA-binding CsgD family transcriptional regulator